MYKIGVYVPETHLDRVKEAMFSVGAGKYGKYDRCSWQVLGTGQFRPAADALPYAGTPGELEIIPEYRLEMICDDAFVARAVEAMLAAHPYEEPAYDIVETKTYKDF